MQQNRVKKIDYLVISHFEDDHMGAVAALAKKVEIVNYVDHGEFDVVVVAAAGQNVATAGWRWTEESGLLQVAKRAEDDAEDGQLVGIVIGNGKFRFISGPLLLFGCGGARIASAGRLA